MSGSAGSICDRRRAADSAGVERSVSGNDASYNDAGVASGSICRTGYGPHDESTSGVATDPVNGADNAGGRLNADNCAWYFTRNSAGYDSIRERGPDSSLDIGGLSWFDRVCCSSGTRSDVV